MFEFSVALKYLIPRWRQLSVSIISLISVIVISLVVWLILVFFSVANGLERNWIDKLIAMTAPIRITPTEEYYRSFYFNIDSISEGSNYTLKSIGEKRVSSFTNPYQIEIDEAIPTHWPKPDLNERGELKDPVKEAFQVIETIPNAIASDFEMAMSNLRLRVARNKYGTDFGLINQTAFLGSFDSKNPNLVKTLITPTSDDVSNLLKTLAFSSDQLLEENPQEVVEANVEELRRRVKKFFQFVKFTKLKTPESGLSLPGRLLPNSAKFNVLVILKGSDVIKMVLYANNKERKSIEQKYLGFGYSVENGKLYVAKPHMNVELISKESLFDARKIPLFLPGDIEFEAVLDEASLDQLNKWEDLRFHIKFNIQNVHIEGLIPYTSVEISRFEMMDHFSQEPEHKPYWVYSIYSKNSSYFFLPDEESVGEGVILPRTYRDGGALLGDQGFLSYYIPTTSSVQEQRIPIYVAGFYDHGIIPIGGKYLLVGNHITSMIRSTYQQNDSLANTGINVRFDDIEKAELVKNQILKAFKDRGIQKYWTVQTFREFEFTRDILQQIRSEKNLFSLIAGVIIIVACSNIISMLIILVNDKKTEIGILRAMGASSKSIAMIFGFCGMMMGLVGSAVGIFMAVITLHHIDSLIGLISRLQGYEVFNSMFYGDTLPNQLSGEALLFVLIATVITSLLAGLIPALKASFVRPSETLRSS